MSYLKKTSPQTIKSGSPSQAIEDSKKKTSLLKDGSWIRKDVAEDEPVDRDSNFGKAVLSRYKSNDAIDSAEPADIKSPKPPTMPSSSVQALSKRFGASQDDLKKSSTLPPSNVRTTTYSTKSSSSSQKSDLSNTDILKTSVADEPKSSTTTTITTISKTGKTTDTVLTTQTVNRSIEVKSPTKPGTFTERVFSDVKSPSRGPLSPLPSKPVITDVNITSNKGSKNETLDKLLIETSETDASNLDSHDITTPTTTKTASIAENELFDALLPKSMQTGYSSPVSTNTTSFTKTEIVRGDSTKSTNPTSFTKTEIVRGDSTKSTNPTSFTKTEIVSGDSDNSNKSISVTSPTSSTRTITSYSSYSSNESIHTSISNTITSKTSYSSYSNGDDLSSIHATTSKTVSSPASYDYTSVSSPTVYTSKTSYTDSSRPTDPFDDSLVSRSLIKTVYSAPERTVQAKDLCSYCRKPMSSDPKMVLDEMKINCHADCFKCEVCNSPLGHLKAGDSMWIYRRTVHCERCFDVTREKWRC